LRLFTELTLQLKLRLANPSVPEAWAVCFQGSMGKVMNLVTTAISLVARELPLLFKPMLVRVQGLSPSVEQ
jgi:hypothetical protein